MYLNCKELHVAFHYTYIHTSMCGCIKTKGFLLNSTNIKIDILLVSEKEEYSCEKEEYSS